MHRNPIRGVWLEESDPVRYFMTVESLRRDVWGPDYSVIAVERLNGTKRYKLNDWGRRLYHLAESENKYERQHKVWVADLPRQIEIARDRLAYLEELGEKYLD